MGANFVLISKKIKFKLIMLLIVSVGLFIGCSSNIYYQNAGQSISTGSSGNGSLKNAFQLDYKTSNMRYFSPFSYYVLGNAFVHSKLYYTLIESYEACETTCPDTKFKLMECSSKKGGKIMIHRTHQHGLSADFMVSKMRNDRQIKRFDKLGIWHYLLKFDEGGNLGRKKNVSIDFESMGKHIIALDNAAKANGLAIKIVILKINLKDDFYKTTSGKEVKRRGIYFAQYLQPNVDKMHDDHYHVDFTITD